MAGAKPCPTCGLINPGSALRCDCGHVFVTRRAPGGAVIDESDDMRRRLDARHRTGWALLIAGIVLLVAVLGAGALMVAAGGTQWRVRGLRVAAFALLLPFGLMGEGVRRIRRAAAGLDVLGPKVEPPPQAKVVDR